MSGFMIGTVFQSRRHESRGASYGRLENVGVFVSDREGRRESIPSHKFDKIKSTTHGSTLMTKAGNVRFSEELHSNCAQEDQRKWAWLRNELSAGSAAVESEFVSLNADSLLAAAKKRKKARSSAPG